MRIYLAAPYERPDPITNLRPVLTAAEILIRAGHIPFVPHLTMLWDLVYPHGTDFWYEYDLSWLEVCDAVLRLPGESEGADMEVARARELGLPVYDSMEQIPVA